jgi:hypothetical protein
MHSTRHPERTRGTSRWKLRHTSLRNASPSVRSSVRAGLALFFAAQDDCASHLCVASFKTCGRRGSRE